MEATKTKKPKAMSKTDLKKLLAEKTQLTGKQIGLVLETLQQVAVAQLNNVGLFNVPGVVKVRKVARPATAEKQGINPFTKAPMTIKAKPAKVSLKCQPFKDLKDSVS